MNSIELAIKKAKEEGGYTEIWMYGRGDDPSRILLDPLFFQALGKAMGWDQHMELTDKMYIEHGVPGAMKVIKWQGDQWLWEWHRFIDHLASGGDVDSFFKDLLS